MDSREATKKKYADIINMQRPVDESILRKHPRMSVPERAKIFAPFAALRGHGDRIVAEDGKLLRQKKIDFSEGELEKLSAKLALIEKNKEVGILYFVPSSPGSDMGHYEKIEGKVILFDPVFQKVRIGSTIILFSDIADVFFADGDESNLW